MTESLPSLTLWVPGTPITQGSMRSVGKGVMLHAKHEELNDWRDTIGTLWRADHGLTDLQGPLGTSLGFALQPFKSAKREWPTSQRDGDLDKYARAVYDALEGIAYANDSQIVMHQHSKSYIDDEHPEPGVLIRIKWEPMEVQG